MTSVLMQYKSTLNRWGLKKNPFRVVPPHKPELVAKLFVGRNNVIQKAIIPAYDGRNVLILGPWGIGKTATIRYLLHKLFVEMEELGDDGFLLYISMSGARTQSDFYRGLALGLANILTPYTETAQEIASNLQGFKYNKSPLVFSGRVSLGIFSIGFEHHPQRGLTINENINENVDRYVYYWSNRLIEKALELRSHLIVAIDDLDKKDPDVIHEILESGMGLFRNEDNISFIMSGRSFATHTQEQVIRVQGVFSENIELTTMNERDLYLMSIKYLNSVREETSDDPFPFTENVLSRISKEAQGVPRQQQVICEKTVKLAAEQGLPLIDSRSFTKIWREIQKQVIYSLDKNQRAILYKILEFEGIGEDISVLELDALNVPTFLQIIPVLKTFEEKGLLVPVTDGNTLHYKPSNLAKILREQGEIKG